VSQLPWYIARSAGLVAWTLLTASVLWGLTMSTRARAFGHRPRPAWMLDLHRWLGGLATIFVGVHVLAILVDSYVHFTLLSVLVPFASQWRPIAVAWGIVGMYLLLAVELTSLARRRLPKRAWRALHFASFPLFLTATVHAFTAGTDASSWAFVSIATTSVMAVAALTAKRIADATRLDAPDAGAARARVPAPRQSAGVPTRV
jgi:methionine sulfoxide reductase heme-binding subunit